EGTWLFTQSAQLTKELKEKAQQRAITLVALDEPLTEHPIKPGKEALPFWDNRMVRDAWLTRIPAVFCAAWLKACPKEAADKIALTMAPELAVYAGRETHVAGLVWRPMDREAKETLAELQKTAKALLARREELGTLLVRVKDPADEEQDRLDELCCSIATLMNGVGVRLARAGDPETAFLLFQKANRLVPFLVSPVLNMGTLVHEALRAEGENAFFAEQKDEVVSLLREFGRSFEEQEEEADPEALVTFGGGELLNADPYIQAGWIWAISGIRFDDTNRLARVETLLREREMPVEEMMAGFREKMRNTQTMNACRLLPIVEETEKTDAAEATGWTRPLIEKAVREMDRGYDSAHRFHFIRAISEVTENPVLQLDLNLLKADFQVRMGGFRTALKLLESVGCFREEGKDGAPCDVRLYRAELGFYAQLHVLGPMTNLLQRWSAEEGAPGWVSLLHRGVKRSTLKPMVREDLVRNLVEADGLYAQARKAAPDDLWELALIRFVNAVYLQTIAPMENRLDLVALGKDVLRLRPHDYYVNACLGDEAASRNDKTTALAYYAVSVQERETIETLNNMTCLLLEMGDSERAYWMALRLVCLNEKRKSPEVIDTIGEALYAVGQYEQALAQYREADEGFGGKQPVVRLHIAETLLRLNRSAEALRILEEIRDKRSAFSVDEEQRYSEALKEAEAKVGSPDGQ
ncbi:MAG: tetratricopeptide repeat protein, partial [Kiritimatiellia bacterium]